MYTARPVLRDHSDEKPPVFKWKTTTFRYKELYFKIQFSMLLESTCLERPHFPGRRLWSCQIGLTVYSDIILTFITGTDSPVNMDSSTIQGPLSSNRSHGTRRSSCERPGNKNFVSALTINRTDNFKTQLDQHHKRTGNFRYCAF